jgi:hypothetical protein
VGGGGEGGCRDKAVAMFMHGGQAADNMTRGGGGGGGARRAGNGQHDERGEGSDNARQAGGGQHNKRVVVMVAEDGGTCPCGCPPMSTPLRVSRRHARRRRGGEPSLLKPEINLQ